MSQAEVDPSRDLLAGLLSLGTGLIDDADLVASFRDRDRTRSLVEQFVETGRLDPDGRTIVETLVSRHLRKHGDDPTRSLASLAIGGPTRESLNALDTPGLAETLAGVPDGSTLGIGDGGRTLTFDLRDPEAGGARFRVLRPHARGGLGAVFVALDGELNREVALKQILDRHADDPASRQRFLAEAEITGGLEHPGIVPVYGLGAYEDGRPFYAMRFIRGDSLKEAIDRFHAAPMADGPRDLEFRRLLRRFLDVCNAIAYAHARGVLHRDIKPANIIVGRHGETLVVDWGLAKARGRAESPRADDETPLVLSSASGSAETLPGHALGTPAYMSPEQARGDLDALGPRSDVYSLGATFYTVLTGKAPFEGKVADVLRAVESGTFPAPRRVDPAIDPALEAIVLKAMASRPEDRYPNSMALADDVERWMADEPVSAWTEPFARHARRWARRHRTTVTAASVLLVTALLGLGAGNVLLGEANRRIDAMRRKAEGNAAALTVANTRIDQERRQAESNFGLARKAVDRYFERVSMERLLDEPGMEDLRRDLMGEAREFYQGLLALKPSDETTERALIRSLVNLAAIEDSTGERRRGLALLRDAAVRLARLPDTPENRGWLGSTVARIAGALDSLGERASAMAEFNRAVALLDSSFAEKRDSATFWAIGLGRSALISGLVGQGQAAEATPHLERLRTLVDDPEYLQSDDPDILQSLSMMAASLGQERYLGRDYAGAEPWYRRAVAYRERNVAAHPGSRLERMYLADTRNNAATNAMKRGDLETARADFERIREVDRELIRDYPRFKIHRHGLTAALTNLSVIYERTNRLDEAIAASVEAVANLEELARNVDDSEAHTQLGAAAGNLGNQYLKLKDFDAALSRFDQAIAVDGPILEANPRLLAVRLVLRNAHWGRADALVALARIDDALPAFDEAARLADGDVPDEIRLEKGLVLARDSRIEAARAVVREGLADVPISRDRLLFSRVKILAIAADRARRDESLGPEERRARAEGLVDEAIALAARPEASAMFAKGRNAASILANPEYGPLLERPEVRAMLLDAAFPNDPFAREPAPR